MKDKTEDSFYSYDMHPYFNSKPAKAATVFSYLMEAIPEKEKKGFIENFTYRLCHLAFMADLLHLSVWGRTISTIHWTLAPLPFAGYVIYFKEGKFLNYLDHVDDTLLSPSDEIILDDVVKNRKCILHIMHPEILEKHFHNGDYDSPLPSDITHKDMIMYLKDDAMIEYTLDRLKLSNFTKGK